MDNSPESPESPELWKWAYQALTDSGLMGILILNPAGIVIEASPGFCEWLGRARVELVGFALPDQLAGRPEGDSRTGEWVEYRDVPIISNEGLERRASWRIKCFPDGSRLIMADLRPVQTQVLAEGLQVAQASVEIAPIAIFQIEDDGRVVDVNEQAARSLGYTREELLTKTVYDFDPLFTPASFRQHRLNVAITRARTFETVHRRKDGHTFPVEITINRVHRLNRDYTFSYAYDLSPIRQREQRLQESEAMLQKSQAIAQIGSFSFDLQEGTWFGTPTMGAILGISESDPHSFMSWLNLIHPDDRVKVAEAFSRMPLDDVALIDIEYRITNARDGRERWVRAVGEAEFDRAGTPVKIIGTLQDITQRVTGEELLKKSEERLRLALEGNNDAVWDWAVDRDEFYVSPELFAIVDLAPRETLYQLADFAGLIHPDEIGWVITGVTKTLDSHTPFSVECRVRNKAGEWIWMLIRGKGVEMGEDGTPTRLTGVCTNITERKQIEQALKETNETLHALIQSAPLAINTVDTTSHVTLWNPAAEALFGWTSEEVLGKMFPPVAKRDMAEHIDLRESTLQGKGVTNLEVVRYKKDGTPLDIMLSTAPLRDAQGNIVGMIGMDLDITEAKRAREALVRGETRLRLVLDATRDGIFDMNIDPAKVYLSPIFYSMLGYEPGDFSATVESVTGLFHPDDYPKVVSALHHSIENQTSFSIEYRLREKSGRYRWILGRGKVIEVDSAGGAVRVAGSNTDIDQLKLTEQALLETNLTLRTLVNSSPLAISVIDPNNKVVMWNQAAERMFGWQENEVIGRYPPYVPPDKRDEHRRISDTLLNGGVYTDLEVQRVRKDGSIIDISLSASRLTSTNGEFIGILALNSDITLRKRTELLLATLDKASIEMQRAATPGEVVRAAAEELKKAGFQTAVFTYIPSKQVLRPVYVSIPEKLVHAGEKLTGLYMETTELPVEKIDTFRLPVVEKRAIYFESLDAPLKQILPGGSARLIRPLVRLLGLTRTINAPLMVEGEVIGIFTVQSRNLLESDIPGITVFAHQMAAVWRQATLFEQARSEIAARKSAEAEVRQLNEDLEKRVTERTAALEAANHELEAFSYSVSHDLRAPLRAIDGYTRLLLEEHEANLGVEGVRVANVIRSETQRMNQLIEDLLAFSRVGRGNLRTVEVEMASMVESVFHDLTAMDNPGRIDFKVDRLPAAVGDPKLLYQVWTNLISNAIKFTARREKALIQIGSQAGAAETVYYIRDNGAGFNQRYADKLFGVFQRLHSEKEFAGTGVGLAIVQRIISRHGGRVWAEGQMNQGATFYFSLPHRGS